MQQIDIFSPPLPNEPGQRLHWKNLQGASMGLALSNAITQSQSPIFIISADSLSAARLMDELHFFNEHINELHHFPDWETLPYDHFSPHQDIISERLAVLNRMPFLQKGAIITTIDTLLHKLSSKDFIDGHSFLLKVGEKLNIDVLRTRLAQAGYHSTSQVREHGEFAVRGSIIDMFPMGSHVPFRIDLLDNEIDTIRIFSPDTQRTTEKISEIRMLPAKEFPLTEEARQASGQYYMEMKHPGLRQALAKENPLQIVGTINAYTALLAERAGFRAIYLSGAGVANASYGLPDLGITNLTDVVEDIYRITYACQLPLLVDIDTGWGNVFTIGRTIKTLIKAGARGIHIEDQAQAKRCGHRPKKELVDTAEMCDRIKAAVDANIDQNFVIMARTDALANEGINKSLERIQHYVAAGADMIFFEGVTALSQYQAARDISKVPILANMTEFGMTPLFTKTELQKSGVELILYPLTAFRMMSEAATKAYDTIRSNGTQQSLIPEMQTREQLYEVLHYHQYEEKLDKLFAEGKET